MSDTFPRNNGNPITLPTTPQRSSSQIPIIPPSQSHDPKSHSHIKTSLFKGRPPVPPAHTHPLFPALPVYGPPNFIRKIQSLSYRVCSFFLGAYFLGVIVLGALFTKIPHFADYVWQRLTFQDPHRHRIFYEEEKRRRKIRREEERAWTEKSHSGKVKGKGKEKAATLTDNSSFYGNDEKRPLDQEGYKAGYKDEHEIRGKKDEEGYYEPTEGGPDPLVCDVGYYARRVGLDVEAYQVQTEDGFLIDLYHVYDPKEYVPLPEHERRARGPQVFAPFKDNPPQPPPYPRTSNTAANDNNNQTPPAKNKKRFPALLIPGLLQSSGAYCTNDHSSLAFHLHFSGFDIWLGNNRSGFSPHSHISLPPSDPRMWSWNIRQMGIYDLSALVSRVRHQTRFAKIGLVCHSQGTTQTFVALAKEQRPELGRKISVFCALAPAAYAGPLVGKLYFKFMRVISPFMFRLMFGVHAFLPIMMWAHEVLHGRIYGRMGYLVFGFLFDWDDGRWDRELRDRMFNFAPTYVSAESMRWWLGREGFAKHKCVLATKEEWREEEREDEHHDSGVQYHHHVPHKRRPKGSTAWYDEQAPPFAMWVAGKDDLVDGVKLLRRFEKGREPHVRVVHARVLEDYEHLDVLWAIDAPERVFGEVKEVLWKTCDVRDECRVPKGCENVPALEPLMMPMAGEKGDGGLGDQTSSGEEVGLT